MVALVSGVALAADCKVLHDAIHKERALMKKKALIENALKVCSDCLVYMLHNNVPVISEQEYQCIFKKKGLQPE